MLPWKGDMVPDLNMNMMNFGLKGYIYLAGHYHGYRSEKNVKEYDDDCLQNQILVTSSRSCFELAYLYTCVLTIVIAKTPFNAICEIYNQVYSRFNFFNFPFSRVFLFLGICDWSYIVGKVGEQHLHGWQIKMFQIFRREKIIWDHTCVLTATPANRGWACWWWNRFDQRRSLREAASRGSLPVHDAMPTETVECDIEIWKNSRGDHCQQPSGPKVYVWKSLVQTQVWETWMLFSSDLGCGREP